MNILFCFKKKKFFIFITINLETDFYSFTKSYFIVINREKNFSVKTSNFKSLTIWHVLTAVVSIITNCLEIHGTFWF